MDTTLKNEELLMRALECWNGLRTFRDERERCKRFTYGDQWQDKIEDGGIRITEEELIRSQGNMPLKNNLIRRLVRNVLGVFRNRFELPQIPEFPNLPIIPTGNLSSLLEQNRRLNRLDELYARTMEEFLISGIAAHKKWFGRRGGRNACWTDAVAPAQFFFDLDARDFRGHDISIIGEIHNMSANDFLATFQGENLPTFANPRQKMQVFEVWHRERPLRLFRHDRDTGLLVTANNPANSSAGAINNAFVTVDEEWHYTFMLADGTVLAHGRSPYAHGRHPYIFKAYPFIDGEIHSFVADIIDQQKLTNRLISMYDWILRASAKGVLLFPEGCIPDGIDINDVADEWSRFNGVIVYRPKPGVPLPQQVSSKSADIGITGLLEIQMKMMEDISGGNGALQGTLENGSMSGTLYNQQTQNSLTALADLLRSYDDFILQATEADASNILQFGW